ncbi:hypothetical protein B1R27_26945 [Streptomyces sp. GKU 895]|nr:hypothetical protein B1R27_26945 [Streptomyces sp. GKU 895]
MTQAELAHHGSPWAGPCRTAYEEGVGAALDELHRAVAPDTLVCGPSGHAVATVGHLAAVRRIWHGGTFLHRSSAVEEQQPGAPVLALLGLVTVRCTTARSAGRTSGPPEPPADWPLGLLGLRLGLSERLRNAVIAQLRPRLFGGTPLLQHQLLRGALADVTIEHLEIHGMLTQTQPGPVHLGDLHRRIGRADRMLLRSFGAAGFLATGPGAPAYVSELLGDLYRPRTMPEPDQ